ncbi:MAG TPA: MATE family efflux transporter [Planctomycetota bacterium]
MEDQLPADAAGLRRETLRLAWPIGVSMVSFTLKGLVDTLMVGRLGTDALAAVGLGGLSAFTLLAFGIGVMRGQKSLVSQYLGAGNRRAALAFGAHAFYLGVVIGLVCLLLSPLSRHSFDFLSGSTALSTAAREMGGDYLAMRLALALPYFLTLAIAEYLRSLGQTRVPMAADLIVHPLNVLFNYTLIFGHFGLPGLGVTGAAIGTGLADTCSLLLLGWMISVRRREDGVDRSALRLDFRRLWRVLAVGTASGVQFTLEIAAFTTVSYFVSALGTVSAAVHQAALQIAHASFMPAVALGDAGSILIGRAVGASNWDGARRVLRLVLRMMWMYMIPVGALFVIFGEQLMGLFLRDPDPAVRAEAIRLGAGVLMAVAAWQIGDACQIAYRFSLRAAGDHKYVMWTGILIAWLATVPIAYTAVHVLDGSVITVWWLWNTELYLGALIFIRRWNSGKWMTKRLVLSEKEPPAA